MADADFAGAVAVGLTAESLREALVLGQEHRQPLRRRRGVGELPDRSHPLEDVVVELRRQILESFLDGRCCETSEVSASSAPTGDRRAAALSGPVRFSMRLHDPADEPLPTRVAVVQLESHVSSDVQLPCTHCRRPLDLRVQIGVDSALPEPSSSSPALGEHAYCTVIWEGTKLEFLQAIVLGQSILASGSSKSRVLLHGPHVPKPFLEALVRFWDVRPLTSWGRTRSRVPRTRQLNGASAKLAVLELLDFGRVLYLAPGHVVHACLDAIFALPCPAAVTTGVPRATGYVSLRRKSPGADGFAEELNRSRLNSSLLFFEPSRDVMRRMCAEVGSEGGVWPPMGFDFFSVGAVDEYLYGFYGGRWAEIPVDLAPVAVGSVEATTARPSSSLSRFGDWSSLERRLADLHAKRRHGGSSPGDIESVAGTSLSDTMAALLLSSEVFFDKNQPRGSIIEMVRSVEGLRCFECGVYDALGTLDPIDRHWCCRFCWEGNLVDASAQEVCALPLTGVQVGELMQALGLCNIGSGRQRWKWARGQRNSWVEFRPRGVLWVDAGIGAWEVLGDEGNGAVRVALYVRHDDWTECRHVLHLWAGEHLGVRMELEEIQREVSRPLGFQKIAIDRPPKIRLSANRILKVDTTPPRILKEDRTPATSEGSLVSLATPPTCDEPEGRETQSGGKDLKRDPWLDSDPWGGRRLPTKAKPLNQEASVAENAGPRIGNGSVQVAERIQQRDPWASHVSTIAGSKNHGVVEQGQKISSRPLELPALPQGEITKISFDGASASPGNKYQSCPTAMLPSPLDVGAAGNEGATDLAIAPDPSVQMSPELSANVPAEAPSHSKPSARSRLSYLM